MRHRPGGGMQRFFDRVIGPFLLGAKGNLNRWLLLAGILILIAGSIWLVTSKVVILKMLPFDNKSEFQVVLDMPEGTSLEQTSRVLAEMGDYLSGVPEVTDYQAYAGTATPINFNGLVRQYYLREGAHLGDIQVNLVDQHHRDRQSHAVASDLRAPLQEIARRHNGNAKIVEIPPGPPVLSPLVAEVYGLDYEGQIGVARQVRGVFEGTTDIVDVDDSVEHQSPKRLVVVDRAKAALLGVQQATIAQALATVLGGEDMSFLHGANVKYAVPIRVEYGEADKADLEQVLSLRVRSQDGQLVPLSEVVQVLDTSRSHSIYHKDLLPVVYVTGDMAGPTDSPLYGMFEISAKLKEGPALEQWFIQPPGNPYEYSVKWDGEWQVTYETFRDMGIAYADRAGADLPAGGGAVSELPGAAHHHGAHPADHHRHHARACAARGQVHRHLHDRHDRAGRHHRAQLHPAGGLHQPAGARGHGVGVGGDRLRGGARQTHRTHGARGHGRCRLHPRRPDLLGAGGLAALWAFCLHGPDAGGDTRRVLRGHEAPSGVDPDRDGVRLGAHLPPGRGLFSARPRGTKSR